MKITNRSAGVIVYEIPERNVKRLFNYKSESLTGESKDVEEAELEALWQLGGGEEFIKHYLLIEDQDWVRKHWAGVPIEYFWDKEKIKQSMLEDSVELLSETLDYAPDGVLDLLKELAWRTPLTDLNKITVLKNHPRTLFDVQTAIANMKPSDGTTNEIKTTTRTRKRQE